MKVKAMKFKLPPEGEHVATLIEATNQGKRLNKYGKEVEQIKFTFELENGDRQMYWCNAVLGPSSNFYELVSSLTGKNPDPEVDTDDLINLRCTVYIEHYTSTTDGKQRSKITAFRVAPEKRQQKFKGMTDSNIDEERIREEVPF